MLKFKTINDPIGLDISDKNIKIIQLKKQKDKLKIQALGKYRLPDETVVNGQINDPENFIKALRTLVARPKYGSVTSRKITACLPEVRTFVKLIRIEDNPNPLAETVPAELERHLPFSAEELYIDWQETGKNGSVTEVLASAAPRQIVDQYAAVLAQAGFSVQALEIEPISICRALLLSEAPKTDPAASPNSLIIDIGAVRSNLTVYAGGTIALSVSSQLSGEAVTRRIARSLDIDDQQAERAKLVCGLDKSKAHGIVNDLLDELIAELIKKIKEAESFFANNFPEKGRLEQIWLTGGGSLIKDLDKTIAAETGIKTNIANPFVHLDESVDSLSKILSKQQTPTNEVDIITTDLAQSYASTVGLALRSFFITD